MRAQSGGAEEIASLRAEIERLAQRLERLERAQEIAPATAQSVPLEQAPRNRPAIRLSGDLRYRHEIINEEGFVERNRQRIRARIGVEADATDDLRLGFVLATGGDNPISANQSLDGGFSRKSLGVDRAFFNWQATERLSLTGGKMGNPFFRPGGHHLIYDSDQNPEGLALSYEAGSMLLNVAGFWVEERAEADDSIMLGGQLGYRGRLSGGVSFTAGVSYYDYRDTKGRPPFFDNAGRGNRLDAFGNLLNDFDELELFGQLDFILAGRPFTVFADYVDNTAADSADTGFAVGATFGQVSGEGTWELGWAYQDLDADAVIATFTGSDFSGGGTGGTGHTLDFSYGLRDRWTFGFKYFLNECEADADNERDFRRLQADLSFRY